MSTMQEESLPDLGSMKVTAPEMPKHIRVKNRRKRYLDLHPEYFGSQLELAALSSDPLLYDRLVRRFQTASEREAEGRQKGYSGVLEADIMRGEAKMEALRNPDPDNLFSYRRGMNGEIMAEEKDEMPVSKDEGVQRWRDIMGQRFLIGKDHDFDYKTVDESEEYDDRGAEEREVEEVYFDSETPKFVSNEEVELKGETGIQDF